MAKNKTNNIYKLTELTWKEAERLYPQCSVMWDINGGPFRSENLDTKIYINDNSLIVNIGEYNFADWDNDSGSWQFYMLLSTVIDTEEYHTSEPDPHDQWDSGDQALRLNGIRIQANKRPANKNYYPAYDKMDVQFGQVLYGLYEHYSDGNTFGSYESVDFKKLYLTYEEAASAKSLLPKPSHGYFGSHIDFVINSAVVG